MPLSVLQRRYRGPRGSATFTAQRPPSVWGQATFFAHRPVPLTGHATFRASRPTPAPQAGSPLLEYTLEVSGLPGRSCAPSTGTGASTRN
ncbi:hypothetical protein [Deinococcus multiflagellatus]|uniref:Uncharacterized protein n=1 Tax=Deinococcus multiflagellatus TaxID=1656887 RepID=A0ABW1ZGW7_9DEIO